MGKEEDELTGHVTLSAIISPEGEGYVALCPELNVSAYASTPNRAMDILSGKVFYYAKLHGQFDDFFRLPVPSKELRQCILSINSMNSKKGVMALFSKKVLSDELHIDMVRCRDCYVALCPELNIAVRSEDHGSALNYLVEQVTESFDHGEKPQRFSGSGE